MVVFGASDKEAPDEEQPPHGSFWYWAVLTVPCVCVGTSLSEAPLWLLFVRRKFFPYGCSGSQRPPSVLTPSSDRAYSQ